MRIESTKVLKITLVSCLLICVLGLSLSRVSYSGFDLNPKLDLAASSSSMDSLTPRVEWFKTYGGSSYDILHGAIQTADGGYALVGSTSVGGDYKYWLVRTDEVGNMLWNHTYGSGTFYSVVETADGGFVMAGKTNTGTQGYVVKTDSIGNTLSTYTRGTAFYSVCKTTDGGYALAGWEYAGWPTQTLDVLLLKLNGQLAYQWHHTYGGGSGGGDDRGMSVIQSSDGGFVVAGITGTGTMGYEDATLIKTDSSGNQEWAENFGGKEGLVTEGFMTVIEDGTGFLSGGTLASHGLSAVSNPWILMAATETPPMSPRQWDIAYDGEEYGSYVNSIVKAENGGYVIAFDGGLAGTNSRGELLWTKMFPTINAFYPKGSVAIRTRDGSYAFAGTNQTQWDNYDFCLIKLDIEPVKISDVEYQPTSPTPYIVVPPTVPPTIRQWEPVNVTAFLCGNRTNLNVESACLFYRVDNGSWSNTTMSQDSLPNKWIGIIPGQAGNVTVDFFIEGYLDPSSSRSDSLTYVAKYLTPGDIDGNGRVSPQDLNNLLVHYNRQH